MLDLLFYYQPCARNICFSVVEGGRRESLHLCVGRQEHPLGKEASLDVGGNRKCRCPPHSLQEHSPGTRALRDMFGALLACKYPLVGLGVGVFPNASGLQSLMNKALLYLRDDPKKERDVWLFFTV